MSDGAMSGKHTDRSIYKGLILYQDDLTHLQAIDKIKKGYQYACILHDRDTDENGELKKPHFHFIVKMDNSCPNSTLAKAIGIKDNYIQIIRSVKGAYDYLTHKYDPLKYQYNENDIRGDLSFDNLTDRKEQDFICLLNLIEREKPKNMRDLTFLAVQNNFLGVLKSNAYLFSKILHN